MIIQQLHDQRVIAVNQDSFYHNLMEDELAHVQDYKFDRPEAFDTEKLLYIMEKLRHGESINIPKYDYKSYKNDSFSTRRVNPSNVIILEGILVFHDPRVCELMNMKALLKNLQYSKFVKPTFDDFIFPTKKYADIIIPCGGENHVDVDLIVQHIHTKLGQHDLCKVYPNLFVINSTFRIRGMLILLRDVKTTTHDFVFYVDRLIRLLVEHGLGHLPFIEKQIITPSGTYTIFEVIFIVIAKSVYIGADFCKRLCGVSIIRSGESMENALCACCKGIKLGKILIHREGDTDQQLIYEKLPQDIPDIHVILLDPILGT
ncbi:hypothetical protein V2J09_018330 [Rumex salicifolius]